MDDLRPNRALRDLIERAVDGENPSAQDAPIPDVVPDADIADLAARENAQVRVAIHTGDDGDFVVAVEPPLGRQRAAIDLCCVVDVSGSMCSSASIKVQGGSVEDMGLSILDVVKHALRTIIAALTPRDRLSIVAFHDTATVVLPLTPMNDTGKIEARQATASLEPLNSTNLWGGIRQGLDVLLPSDAHRAKALFVLTDGQPNVEPPRGHLPTLRLYLDRHPGRCVGDTFGFGYDLQSDLLRDIAVEMGGSYSFIPDAGMVRPMVVATLLCCQDT